MNSVSDWSTGARASTGHWEEQGVVIVGTFMLTQLWCSYGVTITLVTLLVSCVSYVFIYRMVDWHSYSDGVFHTTTTTILSVHIQYTSMSLHHTLIRKDLSTKSIHRPSSGRLQRFSFRYTDCTKPDDSVVSVCRVLDRHRWVIWFGAICV